ncbi:MAG: hypothetical protein R3E10_14925 [Gemmatimonadota bacterium]
MKPWVAALGMTAVLGAMPLQAQTKQDAPNVTVQNDFPDAVTVFLDWGHFDRRLGVVDGHATRTMQLPSWIVGDRSVVRLFVVRKNGEELASQDLEIERGHPLGLIVPTPEPAKAVEYKVLPPEELSETTLTVTNERAVDVVVYAEEHDEFDVRLGTVPAHSTKTLEFPTSAVRPDESVMVVVHPLRGLDLESYPLQIRRGEHLALTLKAKG